MSLETYVNKNRPLLDGDITNSDTIITLSTVAGLPIVGKCRLKIEEEILIITLNGSTTVSAYRGAEFTTAVSHLNGTTCYIVITGGALNQSRLEFFNYVNYSSRGLNGNIGRWNRDSDGTTMGRDNGSTWDNFGWCPLAVTSFDSTGFSGYGFAALTASNACVFLANQGASKYLYSASSSGSAEQVGAFLKSLPVSTVPWTAILGLQHNIPHLNSAHAGLCIYESTSGKLATWGLRLTGSENQAASYNFTISNSEATTATCIYNSPNFSIECDQQTGFKFYMIKYIPTESTTEIRLFESVDGINWLFIVQLVFGNGMSFPTHVGFYLDYYTSTNALAMYSGFDILHWSFTEY